MILCDFCNQPPTQAGVISIWDEKFESGLKVICKSCAKRVASELAKPKAIKLDDYLASLPIEEQKAIEVRANELKSNTN